ncbi:MAG: DUF3105 domain-containing protein [Acidimicrobiia bacterium]|nr:DUF3105 domain-containing protein [Acidimicrobiia bacterium]MDH3398553.1 DUF3105 domain-containing protein [Acidimicrobiia bacterium]
MARPKRGRTLERRRAEEARRKEAAAAKAGRRRAALLAVGAVLVVGAAIVLVAIQPPVPGLVFADQGNRHLTAIDEPHPVYNSRPPSSGPHMGGLANWGESAVELPPELYVHNLEDGGVVLAYSCESSCTELVEGFRQILAEFEGRNLLVMPYGDIVDPDGLAHQAAAVAWGRVLYFDDLSDSSSEQLDTFIRTFEGIDHHESA